MSNRLQSKTHTTVKELGKHVPMHLSILFQGGEPWECVLGARKAGGFPDTRTGGAVLIHTDTQMAFPSRGLNWLLASLQS